MSTKLISLLLAVCILFCLSACGTTETSGNVNNTPSESQTDTTQDTNESVLNEESNQEPSNTENSKENYNTQTQTQTNQSNPTSTTDQTAHTHSYSNATCTSPKKCSCGETSGSMLGHNYSDATCTSPKKCTRCGSTEGTALGHNYEKGECTICKVTDEGKYVEEQIKAADQAFTDYTQYNAALMIIKVALQKYPQNDTLKAKREYYQSFAPLYLSDVEPYSKTNWFKLYDEDTDVFNTNHHHCIRIERNFTTADGIYDLSAKYNTFNATVYGLGDGNSGSLKIYADDVCVYSNTSISPNTRPFKISLDITGVMDLKFEMKQYYNSYLGECFGLSDVCVQKTIK